MGRVRSRVEVLTRRELDGIHRAALEILWEVGVAVPNERLLARLRSVGADVQREVARIPERVISRMLAEAIRRPGRRAGARPRRRGPVRVTNGNEMLLLDYETGTRRPGMLDDVIRGIVVTNALPTVGWALPVVVPADVPLPVAAVECYRLGCLYSRKPFNVYFGRRECPYLLRMGEVVAASLGVGRRDLGLGYGFGIVSPLKFAAEDLECALLFAEQGWPAGCYSFVTVGASAPATMAGSLALANAERLACLTLMWLWGEIGGYREGFVDDPCMMEPRTLATSFAHPNLTTLAIATSQISRYYGLGSGGGGLALSDAKGVDYQAGFERGMGAVYCILAGGGIGNSGIVGPDEALSLEQMVLDDASLQAINWIQQGIVVDQDTLAVDLVKQVGIGGTFMDQEHTVQHLRREYWDSPLFTRLSWTDWERRGSDTPLQRAHREVERILAEGYPPQPLLDPSVGAQLEDIVQEARAALVEGTLGEP
ncbi:MAG: trimethylamine methyltransferase family protein [Anaerolineae bacterium]